MVSPHLKNISQNGILPQAGVKIKNIWNHHLDELPEKSIRSVSCTKNLYLGWRSTSVRDQLWKFWDLHFPDVTKKWIPPWWALLNMNASLFSTRKKASWTWICLWKMLGKSLNKDILSQMVVLKWWCTMGKGFPKKSPEQQIQVEVNFPPPPCCCFAFLLLFAPPWRCWRFHPAAAQATARRRRIARMERW